MRLYCICEYEELSLTLPLYNDDLGRELNKVSKQVRLGLSIKTRGGRMMQHKYALPQETQPPIPPRCCPTQMEEKLWRVRKCCYHLKCSRCDDGQGEYIGQTGRPVQERVKDHARAIRRRDVEACAYTEHYLEKHPEHVHSPRFEVKILTQGDNHIKRLTKEAYLYLFFLTTDSTLNPTQHLMKVSNLNTKT